LPPLLLAVGTGVLVRDDFGPPPPPVLVFFDVIVVSAEVSVDVEVVIGDLVVRVIVTPLLFVVVSVVSVDLVLVATAVVVVSVDSVVSVVLADFKDAV